MGASDYFNQVGVAYDAHRPGYPDELIDHAIGVAELKAGDPVVEIGPGTGQLTAMLAARGLKVTAVEPGAELIALARQKVDAEFIHARLEDAELPAGHFKAAFAASAINHPDPDVSWQLLHRALAPGGTLALISYYGLAADDDQPAQLAAWAEVAHELAARFPQLRDLDTLSAGIRERSANVSEAWAWFGRYDVARDYAAQLFDDVQLATVTLTMERTAEQTSGFMSTNPSWGQLTSGQQRELTSRIQDLAASLGRPLRSSTVAVLVTAKARR
ncbi:MAG: class I SAM-dependent methyltransferase [Solirubrobacterales bacterium]|nr:class I SAM-dependent methyltransferase [Solirubrobacterales bacterium]